MKYSTNSSFRGVSYSILPPLVSSVSVDLSRSPLFSRPVLPLRQRPRRPPRRPPLPVGVPVAVRRRTLRGGRHPGHQRAGGRKGRILRRKRLKVGTGRNGSASVRGCTAVQDIPGPNWWQIWNGERGCVIGRLVCSLSDWKRKRGRERERKDTFHIAGDTL